jgi:hypothetical protein
MSLAMLHLTHQYTKAHKSGLRDRPESERLRALGPLRFDPAKRVVQRHALRHGEFLRHVFEPLELVRGLRLLCFGFCHGVGL